MRIAAQLASLQRGLEEGISSLGPKLRLGGLKCIVQAFAGKSLGVSERVGSGQVKQAEVRGRGPEAHPRPPSPREGLRDVALCSAGGRELATCPLTSSLCLTRN